MEVKFGANQVPADGVTPQPQPAAPEAQVPAPIPSGAVAPAQMLLGDRLPTFTEIILPRLNLVQNIGLLKEQFESGSIVFGQSTVLYLPEKKDLNGTLVRAQSPPVIMTFLGFKPEKYVEKVEGGARGLSCDSPAQVRELGGTTDWAEWNLKKTSGMKRFEPMLDALVAVERPACCVPANGAADPVFNYEVDGKLYALAFWALRGVVYTDVYKRVLAPGRFSGFLRVGGYPSWSVSIRTKSKSFDSGKKSAWSGVAEPVAPSSPAMLEFVKSVLNPQPASA
jgi:hypothetical protein